MIRGMIFDFDGLILDTEWPVYQSWVDMFDSFNTELPLNQWTSIIGTSSNEHFNPFDKLEDQIGQIVDRQLLNQERHDREMELVYTQPILPGVEETLEAAKARNLKLGIASSSNFDWVGGNLNRLGLSGYFDVVHTSDDVERSKPDPALYLLALQSLELSSSEAIVFEDSPNGVSAAKDAGIFTVAVPNPLTANLNLSRADLIVESLAAISLDWLIQFVKEQSNEEIGSE